LAWPDGSRLHCGADEPQFRCHLRSTRAVLALLLRNELRLGEAFLDGDIDLEGDLAAMLLRSFFNDISPMRHGVCWTTPSAKRSLRTNRDDELRLSHSLTECLLD
jgi:cyclopropane-fatty-acyl-phospholipid synthase